MIDNPVNPAHYQKRGGFEVIDFIEAVCADLPGDEAALVMPIIKYVSRYRQKHPKDPVRDLKKGLWFLDRLIKMVEAKQGEVNLSELLKDPAPWATFKTNTPRPGDAPGSRERKSDTDGWRDDYSNKGPNLKHPCSECGSEPGRKHRMSCSEYTGHY